MPKGGGGNDGGKRTSACCPVTGGRWVDGLAMAAWNVGWDAGLPRMYPSNTLCSTLEP